MRELVEPLKKIRKVNAVVVLIQAAAVVGFYKVLTDYYRPEFADSLRYLALSFVGIIPFAFIAWGGSILVMTGKLKANIERTLFLLLFTISTSLVLTYFFGMEGAVYAVILNGIFAFFLLFGFVKKETGIRLV
jgi:O-antigen/teichoic acid export membrane protein